MKEGLFGGTKEDIVRWISVTNRGGHDENCVCV